MAKRKRSELGFDLDQAIHSLHQAALEAGVVIPLKDPRAASPAFTAVAHLHGLEATSCRESPCRRAGICHALAELVQHKTETEILRVVVDAAQQTHEVRNWLDNFGHRYAETLGGLLKRGEIFHSSEYQDTELGKPHAHETFCIRPERILLAMTDFRLALKNFDVELRKQFWSPQLRQSARKKRGDVLLAAVWQHLSWGGLTYAEIFKLVPDQTGNDKGATERVRNRVSGRESRSLLPRELHPEFRKQRRSDKRKKPHSSS